MPGYGGTAESPLIAGRRDHEHAALNRLVKGLFERSDPIDGRLRESEAQVDHPRARVHAVEDRRREFLRRCARHGFTCSRLGENGPNDERAAWTDAGAAEPRFADRIPATKVP
jgi:hypothetical protein